MPRSITKVSIVPLVRPEFQLNQSLPIDLGNGLSIQDVSPLISQSELHFDDSVSIEHQRRVENWKVCLVHQYEDQYVSDLQSKKSFALLSYVLAHLRLIVPHKTILGNYLQARLEDGRLRVEKFNWTIQTICLEDCERMCSAIKPEHLTKLKGWLPWIVRFQANWMKFYPLHISMYWSEKGYLEEDAKLRHVLRVMALEALVSSDKDYGKTKLFLPRLKKLLGPGTDLYEQYRCEFQLQLTKLVLSKVVANVWKLRHKIAHGDKIPNHWKSRSKRQGTLRMLSYADKLGEASASMVSLAWRKIIDSGLQSTFADKSRMESYLRT